MNCIFLCDYAALYGGNFIPSLIELEKTLERKGIKCYYVFPNESKEMPWCDWLCRLGKNVSFTQFECSRCIFVQNVCKIIDDFDAQMVYSHFCSAARMKLVSFLRRKTSFFVHLHSDFFLGKNTMKKRALVFLSYKLLSKQILFLSVSKEMVKYNPKRIKWIPNGLAPRYMDIQHINGDLQRKRLGVKNDELLFEVFGWSPIVKGVDVAVNAIYEYNKKSVKKAKLMIVCGIEYTPEKMKDFVSHNTNCYGNEDYLLYVEPKEDVFSFHEAADCLLSTSRSEGFSYAILEMLSLGKNCIVSDIPGVEWSKEYIGVQTFASEDVVECCKTIFAFANRPIAVNQEDIDKINHERNINLWVDLVAKELEVK